MRQTTRTLLTLGALILVGGAFGLYAFFGVAKVDEAEAERKESTERVFAYAKPGEKSADGGALQFSFTSITVKAKGETTTLEKRGDAWHITSPVQAKADKLTVDSITSQLQTAKFKAELEENPDEATLEKYGLKAPQFTVTAFGYVPEENGQGADDPSRRREVTLHGGIENTFDGSVYVMRNAEKKVYVGEGGLRWALEKTTYDLRDKEVLAFEPQQVKSIELKSKANQYRLERDGEKWRLARPFSTLADATAVATMLSGLKAERAVAFPSDTPEARKSFGLEPALIDATFQLEGGAARVRLGRPSGDTGDKVFALREQDGAALLAELPASALGHLDKNPADLKDRSVLSFKQEDVTRIQFQLADGKTMTVERPANAADEWKVTEPEPGPAKRWKISSLLWSLASLKATAAGEENPKDWAKFGIDAQSRGATLFGADGKELARLQLGKDVAGKPNVVYARGAKPQVVEVETTRLNDLPTAVGDLLDAAPADAGVLKTFANQ